MKVESVVGIGANKEVKYVGDPGGSTEDARRNRTLPPLAPSPALLKRSGYDTESSDYSEDSTAYDDAAAATKSAGQRKNINRGRWTKEEDKRLKMYVSLYSENWEAIAAQFTDRSDVQCQQRWTKVVNPELVKGPWTKESWSEPLNESAQSNSSAASQPASKQVLHFRQLLKDQLNSLQQARPASPHGAPHAPPTPPTPPTPPQTPPTPPQTPPTPPHKAPKPPLPPPTPPTPSPSSPPTPTPTPFKMAMAELGKKSGLRYEPSSPGLLVEDITEMIQREENSDGTVQLSDSMLSSAADQDAATTQSKTLAGDSSVLFSPPSIVKHSLLEESSSLHSIISGENTPLNNYDELDIEGAISERTKVQHGPTNPPEPNYRITYEPYAPRENQTNQHAFRNITNRDSRASFSRLNADRLKTIASPNELACDGALLAPKSALANALAEHIYKVTNQKPSTARLDEILTNKIAPKDYAQKENQWWQAEKDSGQGDEMFSDYYMFSNM
ncbi:unnamed protein product, partial [Iphiclides podalirius]